MAYFGVNSNVMDDVINFSVTSFYAKCHTEVVEIKVLQLL